MTRASRFLIGLVTCYATHDSGRCQLAGDPRAATVDAATWLQMICALEIFQRTKFDQPLDRISPWLDILSRPLAEVLADLAAQTHRRFIKTYTPRRAALR